MTAEHETALRRAASDQSVDRLVSPRTPGALKREIRGLLHTHSMERRRLELALDDSKRTQRENLQLRLAQRRRQRTMARGGLSGVPEAAGGGDGGDSGGGGVGLAHMRMMIDGQQRRRERELLHTDFEVDQRARGHATGVDRARQQRHAARKARQQRAALLQSRVLESVEVFAAGGLSRSLLRKVAGAMTPVPFAAGDTLVEEGAPGDRLFVITEGTVDFFALGRRVNTMGVDDYFGEVSLLAAGARSRRTATAVARTDGSALALHRADFRRLFPDAAEAVGVAFRGWFFGDADADAGDLQPRLSGRELPSALATRDVMRRRSVTFRDADVARLAARDRAIRRWRSSGQAINAARYMQWLQRQELD
jgi:CRP-like cAMP-binding protein